jgi:hypothetical protein
MEIVLTPRKAFHVRTIYSGTFENSTNSPTHQGTFMSEEFKIMPTEGSTIGTIAPGLALTESALSTLSRSKYHRWESPNDPSNNTSNYDIFKTTESFPLYILGLRISDFPLKNAPCKNAHPLSLPHFELFVFISAFVLHWPSYSPL